MRETFFLFAGESYYPAGGWEDFQNRYASLEAAQAAFDRHQLEEKANRRGGKYGILFDWAEVVLIGAEAPPAVLSSWDHEHGWHAEPTPEEQAALKTKTALVAKAVWEAKQARLLPCGCEPETPLCAQPGGSCGRCVNHCTCTVEFEAPSWSGRQREP